MRTQLKATSDFAKQANSDRPKSWTYRGHNQFILLARDCEKPTTGRSMTIQDDSYSIKDIMEKFVVQGKTADEVQGLYQDGVNHDSVDLRQVMALDLVDRDELIEEVREREAVAKQKIKAIFEEARRKKEVEENEAVKSPEEQKSTIGGRSQSQKYDEGSTGKKTASNQPSKSSQQATE